MLSGKRFACVAVAILIPTSLFLRNSPFSTANCPRNCVAVLIARVKFQQYLPSFVFPRSFPKLPFTDSPFPYRISYRIGTPSGFRGYLDCGRSRFKTARWTLLVPGSQSARSELPISVLIVSFLPSSLLYVFSPSLPMLLSLPRRRILYLSLSVSPSRSLSFRPSLYPSPTFCRVSRPLEF